jgi:hypothetical protein
MILVFLALLGFDAVASRTPRDLEASYQKEQEYLRALPKRVLKNLPELYLWDMATYQKWLRNQSLVGAEDNFAKSSPDRDALVSRLVTEKHSCHFYSMISPSVQSNGVEKSFRNRIVSDFEDLISQCHQLRAGIQKKRLAKCSSIEFAGHSTVGTGLDTVFGIDFRKGTEAIFPKEGSLKELGKCLRSISAKGAKVVMSVCGGETSQNPDGSWGQRFHWPGKEKSQRKLVSLLQMPVLSGVGPVVGTSDGGVWSPNGWHWSDLEPSTD